MSQPCTQVMLCVCVCVLIAQLCLTLCDPMDCSPPGSSICRILQARILEWIAIPFSKRSSWPRDQTHVSCVADRFFTACHTREAHSLCLCYEKLSTLLKDLSFLHLHLSEETPGIPAMRLIGLNPSWEHQDEVRTLERWECKREKMRDWRKGTSEGDSLGNPKCSTLS